MGDNVPDPCECIEAWNQEFVMRRLINLIRQGQTYCTDTDCSDEPTDLQLPSYDAGSWLGLAMLAMVFLWFALRPRRNRVMDVAKPRPRNSEDRDGAPPPPRV